ncbi:reverse transcriptase domain-containing protein [Tanacetum coccineum]
MKALSIGGRLTLLKSVLGSIPIFHMSIFRVMTEAMCDSTILSGISAPLSITSHNMMTSNQSSGLEIDNPHDHIRGYPLFYSHLEDLVSKFINEFFPPSRTTNLRNEIFNFQQRFDVSFHEAWDRYKDLLRACPHHGFTELHQLDTFYNALNPADQDSLNSAAGGNLLERLKSSDVNSSSSSEISQTYHAGKSVTSAVIQPMTAILNNFKGGERVEETLTDPELAEYTIKVPPPLVQKAKPTSLKNYVVHKRDPLHPNIPYPSRMHQEKQQEKDGSKFTFLAYEEFEAYLASDSFPPGNDDLPFDIESDLREIEYLLNNDPTKEMDSILEDSVNEGNLLDPINYLMMILSLDLESSDFLPSPEYDSVIYEDFSEVDTLTSTDNEDKDCSDFEASRARGFVLRSLELFHPQLHFGNPISKSFIFEHTL